jgi:hypothetical protein
VPGPHAGQPFHPAGVHTQVSGRPDQHFLEVPDIAVHIAAIGTQIDDWVADDLAGSVVRDIAAASGFVNLNAAGRQCLAAGEEVRPPAVAFDAEGQHMRVFDEQQDVLDAPGTPFLDEAPLERQRLAVRKEPQATDV